MRVIVPSPHVVVPFLHPPSCVDTLALYCKKHPIFSRMICRIPGWKWDSGDEEVLALAHTLRGVAFTPKERG
jgi:hypothetical protein